MSKKKTIIVLIMGALVVSAALGAVAYKRVLAAEPAAECINIAEPVKLAYARGPQGGYSSEDLAEALGITVDELESAIQTARQAALAQAVEDGLITQAQADALTETGRAFPFGDR